MPVIRDIPAELLEHTEPFGHIGPFVYFIQAESGGPVKIGFTFDLTGRLKSLQTGCPVPLVIRYVVPGGRKEETLLHRMFAECRQEGEWFSPPELILAYGAAANKRMRANGLEEARRARGEMWAKIQELYLSGLSVDTIAREIGCSRALLFRELRKMRDAKYVIPMRRRSQLAA